MNNKHIQNSLALMEKNFEIGDYNSVIKTSGTIFEIIFKQIIQEAMGNLPRIDRELLLEKEQEIGDGKSYQDFTLGQIAGYFRVTNILQKWSKYTKKDLGVLKSFDIEAFRQLRNNVSHNELSIIPERTARLYHSYLLNWLAFLGLQDLTKSVKSSFEETPKNESVIKQSNILKNNIKSAYTSSLQSELERLKVQSLNNMQFDLTIFKDVFQRIGKTKSIVILDFGCADGTVAYDRFNDLDIVSKVIGVDINQSAIERGKELYGSEKFKFYNLDILSLEGNTEFKKIMEQESIESFDFIYCAYVIHHLSDPRKTLVKLRSLLQDNGVVFMKAEDDQQKVCYPDPDNLSQEIIKMQTSMSTTSDRYFARKIYHLYKLSGYNKIKLYYDVRDTVGKTFEERLNLFIESFSYRKNYVKVALDNDPTNEQLLRNYEWIDASQEELMYKFAEENFYYTLNVTVGIASKY